MASVPWKSSLADTLQAIEMLLYAFGAIEPRPFDNRRAEDRRMRAVTSRSFRDARKLLGVRLEPANKDGFRSWRLPRDWRRRLEVVGIKL